MIKSSRFLANVDWQLVVSTLLLSAIGMLLLYSAGFEGKTGTSLPMTRQAASFAAGFSVFCICAVIQPSVWRRLAIPLYLIGSLLLVLVLLRGAVAGGSQRWLNLGFIRVQPSEFMKVGLVLALARVFSSENAPKERYGFLQLLLPSLILLLPVGLIIVEPDLGTSLCYILIGGSMLLLVGVKRKVATRLCLLASAFCYPAWSMLKEYQKKRILSFINPELDPLGIGYHSNQSKIAVGSGALTGKGYLQGTQTQLSFLPEQTTDFIFSVLAEEWGFIGSISVIILYGFLIMRIFAFVSRSSDRFSAYVSVGVASMFFWHIVINIGMATGTLPVVGLTLPLLSYGGSSLVTMMAGLGIVTGMSSRRFMFKGQ